MDVPLVSVTPFVIMAAYRCMGFSGAMGTMLMEPVAASNGMNATATWEPNSAAPVVTSNTLMVFAFTVAALGAPSR